MAQKRPKDILELGNLILDQDNREVTAGGETHHLTPMEWRLLATFMQHPNEILTREFLMEKVWETSYTDDTRTLQVHVSWLRKKIEEDSSNPKLIQTVRGVGYVFSVEQSLCCSDSR